METTHGTWGERRRIFQNSSCLVTELVLEPNKRCSWHHHKTAFNKFYVQIGELGVKTEKGLTVVKEGCSFDVEPGLKHEFQTYNIGATIIEVAYVQFNEHDIHRKELGGDLNE